MLGISRFEPHPHKSLYKSCFIQPPPSQIALPSAEIIEPVFSLYTWIFGVIMPTTRPTAHPTTRSGRQIGKKVFFEDTVAAAESSRSSRPARSQILLSRPSASSRSRSASKPRSALKSRP